MTDMATAADIQDEFLTCTICYDLYVKPTSLPCLHTFCFKCLSSYIDAEDDRNGVSRKRCFRCPLCRAVAQIADPYKPVWRWAESFKSNFFIENLISSMKLRRGTSTEESQKNEANTTLEVSASRSSDSTFFSSRSFSINSNSDETYIHVTNLPAPYEFKEHETLKVVCVDMPACRETKLCGICVLNDVIVTLDFENNAVKTFANWRVSLEMNMITHAVLVPSAPTSVTKKSLSEVAVVLPRCKKLYVLKVTPVLKIISVHNTARRYEHIAHAGSSTVVAVVERSGTSVQQFPIDVVNYQGITLKSVKLGESLSGFSFRDVAVSESGLVHLLRADQQTIHCITQDGLELYRYKQGDEQAATPRADTPPNNMAGLCYMSDNLYTTDVSDCSVSEACCDSGLPVTRERIISAEHGLVQPTSIDVTPDGTVFVACWDGYVRVFVNKRNRPIVKPVLTQVRETAV